MYKYIKNFIKYYFLFNVTIVTLNMIIFGILSINFNSKNVISLNNIETNIKALAKRNDIPDYIKYMATSAYSGENYSCEYDSDCNNGRCLDTRNGPSCFCNEGWITNGIEGNGNVCSYQQRSSLVALLLSIFLGYLGVDWFYLCRNNGGYIAGGIFKLLTCGGFGIWYIVDIARIAAQVFLDGNNLPLEAF